MLVEFFLMDLSLILFVGIVVTSIINRRLLFLFFLVFQNQYYYSSKQRRIEVKRTWSIKMEIGVLWSLKG